MAVHFMRKIIRDYITQWYVLSRPRSPVFHFQKRRRNHRFKDRLKYYIFYYTNNTRKWVIDRLESLNVLERDSTL